MANNYVKKAYVVLESDDCYAVADLKKPTLTLETSNEILAYLANFGYSYHLEGTIEAIKIIKEKEYNLSSNEIIDLIKGDQCCE